MADEKKDNTTSGPGRASGSGSDTVSAAKISAGTSVGNVGQSPMPQSAAGDRSSTGTGAGSSMGSPGTGSSSQFSTSRPGTGSTGTGSSGSAPGAGSSGSSGIAGGSGSHMGTSGPGSSAGTSGSSGMGSPTGTSAQSSTLGSHTSRPMGGGAGPTGAGQPNLGPEHQRHIAQPQAGQGAQGQHGSSGSQAGMGQQSREQGVTEQVKQAASQAGETARQAADQVSDFARETYDRASEAISGGSDRFRRARSDSRQSLGRVQDYAAQNPVMVGLVGLAAGLLIGALLPRTRREDETFGEWSDEVRDQSLRYAHEMGQRGREYVEETLSGEDTRSGKRESDFRPGTGSQSH
jgi:ElaB/YqjD/DUF883 family membrane-anchored ribosome-binding protein